MPELPAPADPTLAAIDAALEARSANSRPSFSLGASEVGNPCERALWYSFRWATPRNFDAASLKRFEDGNYGETVMAERLRMVEGLELSTATEDGKQHRVWELEGHFTGKIDGAILGLLQAPATWHVWEHKQVDDKKLNALEKAKRELGEKNALRSWDEIYYAQAVVYMHLTGMTRHYLTASSPGGRRTVSCRSEENPEEALRLLAKARRVIKADRAPERIGPETFFRCRMCAHAGTCHGNEFAQVNCRTCLHSTPIEDGQWHCQRWGRTITRDEQREGCPAHLYIPDMVPGEQIDAGEDWVGYKLRNEEEWKDGNVGK